MIRIMYVIPAGNERGGFAPGLESFVVMYPELFLNIARALRDNGATHIRAKLFDDDLDPRGTVVTWSWRCAYA